jgi:hypothetical protein
VKAAAVAPNAAAGVSAAAVTAATAAVATATPMAAASAAVPGGRCVARERDDHGSACQNREGKSAFHVTRLREAPSAGALQALVPN